MCTHVHTCVCVCALSHNDLLSVRVSKSIMVCLCARWQFTAKKLSHAMITGLYGWHFTAKCQRHFSEREIVSSVSRIQRGSYAWLVLHIFFFFLFCICHCIFVFIFVFTSFSLTLSLLLLLLLGLE